MLKSHGIRLQSGEAEWPPAKSPTKPTPRIANCAIARRNRKHCVGVYPFRLDGRSSHSVCGLGSFARSPWVWHPPLWREFPGACWHGTASRQARLGSRLALARASECGAGICLSSRIGRCPHCGWSSCVPCPTLMRVGTRDGGRAARSFWRRAGPRTPGEQVGGRWASGAVSGGRAACGRRAERSATRNAGRPK